METLNALLRSAEADGDGLLWFRATSDAKDRHGTVIRAAGVDTSAFLRNPIVGWAHRAIRGGDPEDVLGRVESIERTDDAIDVGVRFADHERAALTEKLVRGGFVRAMSVGILPRKTATEKINGTPTPVVRESELIEVSIVPVGSNPEAQRVLRDLLGEKPNESEVSDMDKEAITKAIADAVKPIGDRLDGIEKTLDEPEEKRHALGGGRTNEDVDALAGKWLKARAFRDHATIQEIASNDPGDAAVVRDMLSADAYLPTQVSNRLITLVGESSKFLNKLGSITGSALSIEVPREASKLSADFIAENATVISGGASLDSLTLTAKNAWTGERVPNRVLRDQPVNTAAMLLRQAADAMAVHFDRVAVEGTQTAAGDAIEVTSGLLDLTDDPGITHDDSPADTATAIAQVVDEYFLVPEEVRPRSTWVISEAYAKELSGLVDGNGRPIFGFSNAPLTATFDGQSPSTLLGRPVIVVPTTIITSSGTEERAFLGDLSRAVLVYRRQNLVAESSRDAEFALDNTLFRFGWRYDIAIVEAGQVRRYGTP